MKTNSKIITEQKNLTLIFRNDDIGEIRTIKNVKSYVKFLGDYNLKMIDGSNYKFRQEGFKLDEVIDNEK